MEEKNPENIAPEEEINKAAEAAEEAADAEVSGAEVSEAKKLKEELDSVKDKLIRSLAEYDNFRKRSVKEKADAYAFSKADVITKLLPVMDNFGRAAANDKASPEDYKKGVEMIFKQFTDIFEGLGVEAFGEKGETFDPNIHSAVMHVEDEAFGEGEITDVFAKGYKLGDKILRPATVKVAN
ncbi:MAG: nucleotide exchange factor GrpE [Clostridia bacterium]|nr:nucleotide exchange factor GrpE [Clostridia bacterium]